MKKTKIKKNDQVLVISGKDRGSKGKVLRVLPAKELAIVERVTVPGLVAIYDESARVVRSGAYVRELVRCPAPLRADVASGAPGDSPVEPNADRSQQRETDARRAPPPGGRDRGTRRQKERRYSELGVE